MADITLAPLTPLGHAEPLVETLGPWTLTEVFDEAMASLAPRRGQEAAVSKAAAKAGIPLPPPARFETGPAWSTFWLTPEMWMVAAPLSAQPDIRAELLSIFGASASITEQTDGWVRFDLAGADLPRLFERLCNVDLAAVPEGFASRTLIEHMGCYLIRRHAGLVTVYGGRSSAGSLHHAIKVAALSLA